MPQNDRAQLDLLVKDYETDPSKGLEHGLQKDAIQNALGARKLNREVSAFTNGWAFYMELLHLNGKPALAFWDEGTRGLTGDILTSAVLNEKSSQGLLGSGNAEQRLSRFLTRYNSGDNLGPGTFGRGKLVFQAASKTGTILIDSKRSDDNRYIFIKRKFDGNTIKQSETIADEEAMSALRQEVNEELMPLSVHGTRVIILDLKDEIYHAFLNSFNGEENSGAISRMIQETWWEILEAGARIYLKMDDDELLVEQNPELKKILLAKNREKGYRVHHRKNIEIQIKDEIYRIKEIKLVVAPDHVDADFNEIWLQRKRMKIGTVNHRTVVNNRIRTKLSGYLRLEPSLENYIENFEGGTHYGFSGHGAPVRSLKEFVESELDTFYMELGIRVENSEGRINRELNEALKELNSMANDLGLPTDHGAGFRNKNVQVRIKQFILPQAGSERIELGDSVGPILYNVSNKSNNLSEVNITVSAEQGNRSHTIHNEKIIVRGNAVEEVVVGPFSLNDPEFYEGSGVLIRCKVSHFHTKRLLDQVSRMLWIGMDRPEQGTTPIGFEIPLPEFPRTTSRRVELGESIDGIAVKITNSANRDISLRLDIVARKAATGTRESFEIKTVTAFDRIVIPPMGEKEIENTTLEISPDDFSRIFSEPMTDRDRKCELYYSIRYAESYTDLKLVKGAFAANKRNIPFYCGIDPTGSSVFKDIETWDDPDEGKRSDYTGTANIGYIFRLNTGHSSHKIYKNADSQFLRMYLREQMIFQAYRIAVANSVYSGPAELFADQLNNGDVEPHDAAGIIDNIVGLALNQAENR